MKIRTGFVSNSSSSSFLLAGYVIDYDKNWKEEIAAKLFPELEGYENIDWDKDWKKADEFWDKQRECEKESGIKILTDTDDGAPIDKMVVGVIISEEDMDQCGMPEVDISVKEIEEKLSPVREKLGLENKELRIMIGCRAC